jgi:osmotically-inducible protein OsmY
MARSPDGTPQVIPVISLSDRDVKSTVVRRLRENPYTQGSRIRVKVSGGVVTLVGEVASAVARDVARGDAEVVPGVIDVADTLVVRAAAA